MALQFATVQLTQLQLSHAIVAVQDYMKALLVAAETDPQGAECGTSTKKYRYPKHGCPTNSPRIRK